MSFISEVKIIESYLISNFGMIVSLRYTNEILGLKKGVILKSKISNRLWFVQNRIIEFPSVEKPFLNESTINSHIRFLNVENRDDADEKAYERIKENIFQYQIESIFHNEIPMKNETLQVIESKKEFDSLILNKLLKELNFFSENGEKRIKNIGYLTFEVSKMTNSKTIDVIQHLVFLIENGCLEKIADESISYVLTEKGKLINNESDLL